MPNVTRTRRLLMGEILVGAGIIEEHQLPRALQMAKDRSTHIGQALIIMRYLSTEEIEPILEIQQLINEGAISDEVAIETLKVMRRDGLPLTHAVMKVQTAPCTDPTKEKNCKELESRLKKLE